MKKALLIIDIQNDYFTGGTNQLTGSEVAAQNAQKILKKFRSDKSEVIFIQHLSTRPGATFFVPGTKGCEINTIVKPLKNEKVIIKHFPSSFRETELQNYLKTKEITELVVCGMMTHMCVDSTIRAAKDFGYNCTLIADACATKDLEVLGIKIKAPDVHNSFLAALAYFYSTVVTTHEYLKLSEN
jgi:nicotinamidase-related amidase